MQNSTTVVIESFSAEALNQLAHRLAQQIATGREGKSRGGHGRMTSFMRKQRRIFTAWMKEHPEMVRGKQTLQRAACLCWLVHKKTWDEARTRQGRRKGYSSSKALAQSFREVSP